jgi:hypothetical protein
MAGKGLIRTKLDMRAALWVASEDDALKGYCD